MPRRVLQLLTTAQPAGISIAKPVGEFVRRLDPARFESEVWFLEDGPLAQKLAEDSLKVRVIGWGGILDVPGAWRFWRALRKGKFDIIHQHVWGRRARWLARHTSGARLVLHLHSNVQEPGTEPVHLSTGGADAVIANSRSVAEWAVGGHRPYVVHSCVCVPPGATGQIASTESRRGITIGTAGRLVPMKGMEYLIRAMAILRAEFPELRLEIAGTGSKRRALEEESRKLGLEGCVVFLGWRVDLAEVRSGWDVYVQPSVIEPMGLAVLEAMAAGLPVVATKVGGLPELVEEGRTGWLVSPRDPEALAGRIRTLLLDGETRRAMGAAGRARAETEFSPERMCAQVAEVYEEVLRAGSGR